METSKNMIATQTIHDRQMECVIDMVVSMNMAITKAHGIPMDIQRMKNMTVLEFIALFAPNGIRFICDESQIL